MMPRHSRKFLERCPARDFSATARSVRLGGPVTFMVTPPRSRFSANDESLGAGMKLVVHRLQSLLIDVGVNLRGRDIGMPKHFLDDAQIGAVA